MTDFIERVQKEHNALALKINKLVKFITSEDFDKLSEDAKSLIVDQSKHMTAYLLVLKQRIALAKI